MRVCDASMSISAEFGGIRDSCLDIYHLITSTQVYKSILSFLRKGSKKHIGARKALEHGLLRPLSSSEVI